MSSLHSLDMPTPRRPLQEKKRVEVEDYATVVGSTYIIEAKQGVILRASADKASEEVGEVPRSTLVTAVDCVHFSTTVRVRIKGEDSMGKAVEGWATLNRNLMAKCSEPGAGASAPSRAAASAVPAPAPTARSPVGSTFLVVAPRGVILRESSDFESDIVGEVVMGKLVTAVESATVGDKERVRLVGVGGDGAAIGGWSTLKPTLLAKAAPPEPAADAAPAAVVPHPPAEVQIPEAEDDGAAPCCGGDIYPVHYPRRRPCCEGRLYELGPDLGAWRPRLPASGRCWIAPGASLIGRVVLGDDVSVWFNCVLRADNDAITIGDGTNVQDGSVLHADPGVPCAIGKHVTVGHRCVLHGCEIGDGSLVGMGAVVLNHAKIGRNCLIGAGSLVKERAVFPDNSLIIGSPAKLIRTLKDEAASQIAQGAHGYVANSRKFKDNLDEVTEAACTPK